MLSASFSGRLGTCDLEVDLTCGQGVTALVGPSGAGKSSVLRAICGLWRPAAGRIVLRDHVLFDAQAGVDVSPHRRQLGAVFQDVLLFPHMTVRRNLAYGAPHPAERWDEVLDMLDIGALLERMPRNLSGGEAQRVALGRALLSNPDMLLLDEPLTGLDDALRCAVLPYLLKLRDESRIPILYVSHRQDEIATVADAVIRMDAGRTVGSEDKA